MEFKGATLLARDWLTTSDDRKEAIELKGQISLGKDVFLTKQQQKTAVQPAKIEPDVARHTLQRIYENRNIEHLAVEAFTLTILGKRQ